MAEITNVGQRRAAPLLAAVREVLSMYPSMVRAMDEAPRPAHQLAWLDPLLAHATALRDALTTPTDPTMWDLTVEGFHFGRAARALVEHLDAFVKAGERVRDGLASAESRHGRQHRARAWVIMKLGHLFDFYYRGAEPARQRLKVDFVNLALRAAKIPGPGMRGGAATASRSRLVRLVWELCPPCRGCIAAGRGEALVKDLVWERIQGLAETQRGADPSLTSAKAVTVVMDTAEGRRLYEVYRKFFDLPVADTKGRDEARAALATVGITI